MANIHLNVRLLEQRNDITAVILGYFFSMQMITILVTKQKYLTTKSTFCMIFESIKVITTNSYSTELTFIKL